MSTSTLFKASTARLMASVNDPRRNIRLIPRKTQGYPPSSQVRLASNHVVIDLCILFIMLWHPNTSVSCECRMQRDGDEDGEYQTCGVWDGCGISWKTHDQGTQRGFMFEKSLCSKYLTGNSWQFLIDSNLLLIYPCGYTQSWSNTSGGEGALDLYLECELILLLWELLPTSRSWTMSNGSPMAAGLRYSSELLFVFHGHEACDLVRPTEPWGLQWSMFEAVGSQSSSRPLTLTWTLLDSNPWEFLFEIESK